MGIRVSTDGKIVLTGNFEKARRYKNVRPHNAWNRDYKAIVPYPFTWRAKLGRVECDCKEVIEAFQPYYGYIIYHQDGCAIMKHFRKYPQMENLCGDPTIIAMSE